MGTPPRWGNVDCRDFDGYKPCRPGWVCPGCTKARPRGTRILLVHLEALGAVAQTTAILPALERLYPVRHVTWVTSSAAVPILARHPLVDRVLPFGAEALAEIPHRTFDLVLSVDKARAAAGLAMAARAPEKRGFGLDPVSGAIVPMNPEAEHLWRLGIDDEEKFRRNRKSGERLLAEALALPFDDADAPSIHFSDEERAFVEAYRAALGAAPGRPVIGYNTGCADTWPNKKMSIDQFARLIGLVRDADPGAVQILLGGRAETERNRRIAERARGAAIETPTTEGLRRGILYIAACDAVVTGDTSAMWIAIALGKRVYAHFGVSCMQEVDLRGRGRAFRRELPCSPCWRKTCPYGLECLDLDLEEIAAAVTGTPRASTLPRL